MTEANKKCDDFCLQKEEWEPPLRAEVNTLVALRTPRGKAKTQLEISWPVRLSELRSRRNGSPGKTSTPGIARRYPHNPKAAAMWVNKRTHSMRV